MIRNTINILLLVLLLSAQTPLGQVLKFPVLMEHFYKHKKQEGVSFLEFIKDHYSPNHNDADQSEDDQLPFRGDVVQNIGIALLPTLFKADFDINYIVPHKLFDREILLPTQSPGNIFHPPRYNT